jgi:imidazoleglycerol-phosphate dehydratase
VNDRVAKIQRHTKETQVDIELNLDGMGKSEIDTPNGMLNHMMEQIARHGLIDLKVTAKGDISPGWHHLVEDVGIAFGQAFRESVGEGKGIVRVGSITLPLDETLVIVSIDIGGRPYSVVKAVFKDATIGDMPSDLVRHFLEVFALEAKVNLHAKVLEGANDHHKAEALFKALARAIRVAVAIDPRMADQIPSTKGTINK